VRVCIEFSSSESTRLSELALLLYTQQGYRIGVLDFRPSGLPTTLGPGQSWELRGKIKSLPLVEGEYSAGLYLNAGNFNGNLLGLAGLSVSPRKERTGHAPYPAVHRGVLNLEFSVDTMSPVRS
jgi:hypothetical protein